MICQCGCNKPAKREFLQGHDQILRIEQERQVGGVLNVGRLLKLNKSYIDGEIPSPAFKARIKELFEAGGPP